MNVSFVNKNEIKVSGKTQRPTKTFAAWRGKESGWAKIEHMAEVLEQYRLQRKVKGVNLFAAEAHYHEACYHRFSEFHNSNKKSEARKEEINTEQKRKSAAHTDAYTATKEFFFNPL